jgi:hypothetical protein
VRSDLAAFFQNVDVLRRKGRFAARVVVFSDEVGKMQRAAKACGPCSDDKNIGFELFALKGHWATAILANAEVTVFGL